MMTSACNQCNAWLPNAINALVINDTNTFWAIDFSSITYCVSSIFDDCLVGHERSFIDY